MTANKQRELKRASMNLSSQRRSAVLSLSACLFAFTLTLAAPMACYSQGRARGGSAVPATVEQLLADLKAPEEFAVEIFARHPDINYPTCICATPDGELFV